LSNPFHKKYSNVWIIAFCMSWLRIRPLPWQIRSKLNARTYRIYEVEVVVAVAAATFDSSMQIESFLNNQWTVDSLSYWILKG
jgi:hypothetical protein